MFGHTYFANNFFHNSYFGTGTVDFNSEPDTDDEYSSTITVHEIQRRPKYQKTEHLTFGRFRVREKR